MIQNIKTVYQTERRGGAATNVFCVNYKHSLTYFFHFFNIGQPQGEVGKLLHDNYLHRKLYLEGVGEATRRGCPVRRCRGSAEQPLGEPVRSEQAPSSTTTLASPSAHRPSPGNEVLLRASALLAAHRPSPGIEILPRPFANARRPFRHRFRRRRRRHYRTCRRRRCSSVPCTCAWGDASSGGAASLLPCLEEFSEGGNRHNCVWASSVH